MKERGTYMRRIYAIRHAEREDDINPFWYFNSILTKDNVPLSERGEKQAAQLHERFKYNAIDHVFSSPYRRTIQTAKAILEKRSAKVCVEPAFIESLKVITEPVPKFESPEELNARFPNLINMDYRPVHIDVSPEEDTEDILGCKKRVFDAMRDILGTVQKGNILIVGHQSSLAAVHLFFCGKPVYPGQATVSKYVESEETGRFKCEYQCDATHLKDKANLRGKSVV